MFNQNDLDALAAATGLSEMEVMAHEALGAEYIIRQRMYHALGQQGELPPPMIIDMLRSLDFQPPARQAPLKPMEIRWEDYRLGTRVIVTPEDTQPQKQFYGVFKGKPEPGYVSVLLDGAVGGWVDEFPMRQVALAPANAPSFVPPEEPLLDSLRPAPAPQPSVNGEAYDDEDADEELPPSGEEEDALPSDTPEAVMTPGTVDRADPEGRIKVPVMEKDWSVVDPGDPVVYQIGEELFDAEFIEDGPMDGHVSISIDGETKVVPETLVHA